ncbi:XRE family transcriptional regulator [Macrococcoides caseolyticum subsp. caseolyticum]|uniref:helix-turn-helix domain-containing protein n=1 Tax=Macrococcoides caseolyticum TaxID=69966 RepID=UPI000C31FDDA|nr:helix-turn-helix transcriptional regulator [Macrococcus caseolyticus]PKE12801.1 XRE family transcriptional regulator [Macrococcus caseolyticus]PKE52752.1 XRE family transcriptional regulator [Macrococcus caseolyticus]PKE72950.1 XRE family transcriptional regulator [Macrococcus caseolyticus]PKF29581.1 XRE family transcriptional regulator [Macrococcus caseolyticus]PKF38469.1 XRE family transcriptional regulator [Macrococcus caseolyticus]
MDENIILTLEQWRKLKGYTQEGLAKACGVTARTIGNYEKDVAYLENAQYSTLKKIADVLEIKVANIFLDSTSEKPKITIG